MFYLIVAVIIKCTTQVNRTWRPMGNKRHFHGSVTLDSGPQRTDRNSRKSRRIHQCDSQCMLNEKTVNGVVREWWDRLYVRTHAKLFPWVSWSLSRKLIMAANFPTGNWRRRDSWFAFYGTTRMSCVGVRACVRVRDLRNTRRVCSCVLLGEFVSSHFSTQCSSHTITFHSDTVPNCSAYISYLTVFSYL